MLSQSQVDTLNKLHILKVRTENLDRDLLLKNITKKEYNKEKKLINEELFQLEQQNLFLNKIVGEQE